MDIQYKQFTYQLRPQQEKIVSYLETVESPYICIQAPTGVGKSLIGLAWLLQNNQTGFYLCNSISLQKQLEKDLSIPYLCGRSNYTCSEYVGHTAADCINYRTCASIESCEYMRKRKEILQEEKISCLNYDMYLNIFMAKTNKIFQRSHIVIDEADKFEQVISNYMTIQINYNLLKRAGIHKKPEKKTKLESCLKWLEEISPEINYKIKDLRTQILEIQDVRTIHFIESLTRLYKKIQLIQSLNTIQENEWIYHNNTQKQEILMTPIWLNKDLLNEIFYSKFQRAIFMSATLPNKTLFSKLFQIPESEITYISANTPFPESNRKIFLCNTYEYTYKNKNQAQSSMISKVKEILFRHSNEKGLVLTSSNSDIEILQKASKRIIRADARNRDLAIEKLKLSKNKVLCSASFWEGYDGKDDLCRFIIITKIPFGNISDKIISSRLYSSGQFGKLWYNTVAANMIIQGAGRGVRHIDDYCICYILDSQIEKIIKYFPLYIKNVFKKEL